MSKVNRRLQSQPRCSSSSSTSQRRGLRAARPSFVSHQHVDEHEHEHAAGHADEHEHVDEHADEPLHHQRKQQPPRDQRAAAARCVRSVVVDRESQGSGGGASLPPSRAGRGSKATTRRSARGRPGSGRKPDCLGSRKTVVALGGAASVARASEPRRGGPGARRSARPSRLAATSSRRRLAQAVDLRGGMPPKSDGGWKVRTTRTSEDSSTQPLARSRRRRGAAGVRPGRASWGPPSAPGAGERNAPRENGRGCRRRKRGNVERERERPRVGGAARGPPWPPR